MNDTDMPAPICDNCGVRHEAQYVHDGDYEEDGCKYPLYKCLTCGGEVIWD